MSKTSKLEPKKEFIAGAVAAGIPQEEIAQQVGVNQSTVSRFANRDDVKEIIEEQTMSLLEVLPDAVENVKALVRGMRDLPIDEVKARELALKASLRVLESGGILNSSSPSQIVVNLQKSEPLIDPATAEFLRKYAAGELHECKDE